jgi:hypothetical protein
MTIMTLLTRSIKTRWLLAVPSLSIAILAACSTSPTPSATTQPTDPPPTVEASRTPDPVPTLGPSPTPFPPEINLPLILPTPTPVAPLPDLSKHSVPLSEIIFDTFDGGSLPLSEAEDGRILALQDAIRPIYDPVYGPASAGDWLDDGFVVLGYISEQGTPYAYPVNILNLHEIVNDTVDGVPVLVSYCPLCASGIVYDRRLDEMELVFGNTSALYESDMVMFDHQTGSYWFQVGGEALVGELTGQRLTPLPSIMMPWGEWERLHPDTRVLSTNNNIYPTAFYERNPFVRYQEIVNEGRFAFPVSDEVVADRRLLPGDRVLAVRSSNEERGYLLEGVGLAAINDRLNGEPLVVLIDEGPAGAAFSAQAEGRTLTFQVVGEAYVDNKTGSTWDIAGRAVSGPLQGHQLWALPTRTTFWFALVASMPGIELHGR